MHGIDQYCERYDHTNIYFGVGTRNGDGGTKAHLVNIPCVWADIDFKTLPIDVAREKIAHFPLKPSIIVSSGGGIHAYWLLKEPVGYSDTESVEDVNRRIQAHIGSDDVHDASRILRVPDTVNRKPEYNPQPICKVLRDNDFYYNIEDFLEILPKAQESKRGTNPDKKSSGWLVEAMKGIDKSQTPEKSRNVTGTKIAGYFINKLPQQDVLTILRTWNINNKPPLDENELKTIASSVSRYSDVSTKSRVDISNVYDSARMIEEYKSYIKTLKQNRFITGIKQIDKRIRGVAGGEVLTIIARSGSFKTAMLQNLLKSYINNSSWASVFFSIEMPVASLTERYLEILDGCTGREVENLFSDPSEADIQQITENSFRHELDKLFVIPTRVSLSDITAYVQLIERERNIKIGVIGIDYLGLMEGPGASEYEIISRLSTGLKSTAKLLDIPVVVLCQVSRKGASGNSEISLDMGRGSGAIEEAADFVLGLWQAGDEDGEKELICKILKNRKGPINSRWKLELKLQTLQIGPNAEPYKPVELAKGGY
jgi:hypothetical protein